MRRKISIAPEYGHLKDFIYSLPSVFESQGQMMHDGRNVIKLFTTDDGTQLNVKRYHIPTGPNLLIYSSGLRKPKGLRAFIYPGILRANGIETPEAVAYIEERRCGLLGYTYFVSTQCPYEHTMYEMDNAADGDFEGIAGDFARFTARLHDCGIMHMDYSPGNILFTRAPEGNYKFSLVDINRMYFGHVSMRRGLSNLKRLWGSKQFFTDVVRVYARTRKSDEEEALGFALSERRKFWTRYQKKHQIGIRLEL